jgi:RNA binding exosome subunit
MAKLIYNSKDTENKEASIIEFTISEDLNIYEFKTVCIRMASAMGYHYNSIDKAFGSIDYESDIDKKLKSLMKSIQNTEYEFTSSLSTSL